jgi:hypothetical protein
MNVEIGAEAALFPEKEYKLGIFVAVRITKIRGFSLTQASPGSLRPERGRILFALYLIGH